MSISVYMSNEAVHTLFTPRHDLAWFSGRMVDTEVIESAYEAWNRHDVERLVELTHPEVEIAPLVIGVTSAGPWEGHDGVRRLVADGRDRWARLEIRCDEILTFGERAVALVHVEAAARADGPTVSGDIAHVIEFEGELVRRFVAYRDRARAVAAAEA
jgi:ketosteroid isomerase-like protein